MSEDEQEQAEQDESRTVDSATAVAALTAKYGDAQRAAERLYEINQRLTRKVERLARRPDVPDGARVIGAEDAAKLDAYAEIGSPEELRTRLQTADEARTELDALQRREQIRNVATATGWQPEVLANLPGSAAWSFQTRDEQEPDGKGGTRSARVAYIVPEDGKQPIKLREHVSGDPVLSAFLPALEIQQPQTRTSAQPLPVSPADGKPPTEQGGGVDALIRANQDRAKAPNALTPA